MPVHTSPGQGVRRCLFGPVDHAVVSFNLQEEMESIRKQQEDKWNFDFVNERPLPGRWEWEKVEETSGAEPATNAVEGDLDNKEASSPAACKRSRDDDEEAESDVKRARTESSTSATSATVTSSSTSQCPLELRGFDSKLPGERPSHTKEGEEETQEQLSSHLTPTSSSSQNQQHNQPKITDHFVQQKPYESSSSDNKQQQLPST